MKLTDRQRLADFASDVGLPKIFLRSHEELIDCKLADGKAVVAIRRYRVTETHSELRFTARGTVLRYWMLNKWGCWVEYEPILTWDSDFEPYTVSKFERKSPDEHRESELWAAYCYRPGASRYPLDSFDRVAVEDSTPAMNKHWGLTGSYVNEEDD
jgi:hypothetical protein